MNMVFKQETQSLFIRSLLNTIGAPYFLMFEMEHLKLLVIGMKKGQKYFKKTERKINLNHFLLKKSDGT